jgi:hypothetical protein
LCCVLFCSVLFCSVLFCSVLFCSVLFCSALFCCVVLCSVVCIAVSCLFCACVVLCCVTFVLRWVRSCGVFVLFLCCVVLRCVCGALGSFLRTVVLFSLPRGVVVVIVLFFLGNSGQDSSGSTWMGRPRPPLEDVPWKHGRNQRCRSRLGSGQAHAHSLECKRGGCLQGATFRW